MRTDSHSLRACSSILHSCMNGIRVLGIAMQEPLCDPDLRAAVGNPAGWHQTKGPERREWIPRYTLAAKPNVAIFRSVRQGSENPRITSNLQSEVRVKNCTSVRGTSKTFSHNCLLIPWLFQFLPPCLYEWQTLHILVYSHSQYLAVGRNFRPKTHPGSPSSKFSTPTRPSFR